MILKTTVFRNNDNPPIKQLVQLLNKAFKERKDEGINFSYTSYSIEDLREHVGDGYYIVAYDDNDNIVGMVTLIKKKRMGIRYTTHECLAVDPNIKNKGVATIMFQSFKELAVKLNSSFIISSTAEKAYSSIRYHCKNGFKKFLYVSFPNTDYYSYGFVLPLKKRFYFMKSRLFYIPTLWVSYIYTKLFKREKKAKN